MKQAGPKLDTERICSGLGDRREAEEHQKELLLHIQ